MIRGYQKGDVGENPTRSTKLVAYKKCSNIRQTLLEVGLAAKGGNYLRLQKLIANAPVMKWYT